MAGVDDDDDDFFVEPLLYDEAKLFARMDAAREACLRAEEEQARKHEERRRRGAAHRAVLNSILEHDPKTGREVYTRYSFTDFSVFDIDEESLIPPMRFTNSGYIRGINLEDSANILSVMIASSDRGFPINVYGTIIPDADACALTWCRAAPWSYIPCRSRGSSPPPIAGACRDRLLAVSTSASSQSAFPGSAAGVCHAEVVALGASSSDGNATQPTGELHAYTTSAVRFYLRHQHSSRTLVIYCSMAVRLVREAASAAVDGGEVSGVRSAAMGSSAMLDLF
ncbi:hypothetical protein QYE76_008403 [Lolium multiflorum]|uniref:Uncharacterized protein n=1 Tax=Lolium multiflorum TaxID=4521 RepID=A0AAD8TR80_LOLMU|nr:hypothetical protein QYE76_008402 [Lolium multiflorum]KAK1691706.1 hypothetical protein QYE76_008403 [Lolium multiflorum]